MSKLFYTSIVFTDLPKGPNEGNKVKLQDEGVNPPPVSSVSVKLEKTNQRFGLIQGSCWAVL